MRMTTFILACALPCTAYAASADFRNADTQLNANYKALAAQLVASDQQSLRAAQRAWIGFRDKECEFRAQAHAQQATSESARAACMLKLTEERSAALVAPLGCDTVEAGCAHKEAAQDDEANAQSCANALGKQKAAVLVQQCTQVSPATHPPCNADNACDLIRDEIKRGCAMLDKTSPDFCKEYH